MIILPSELLINYHAALHGRRINGNSGCISQHECRDSKSFPLHGNYFTTSPTNAD